MVWALAAVILLQQPGGQQGMNPPPEARSAESLDRIRRGLERDRGKADDRPLSILKSADDDGRPRFRVEVLGSQAPTVPPWMTNQGAPGYIRTPHSPTHHEFLSGVTPELFRSATVYPTGVPVGTLATKAVSAIRAAVRRRQEARARAEVKEALRQFLEERAKEK